MAKSRAERWSCSLVGTARMMSTILSWRWSAGVGSSWAGPKRDKRTTSLRPRDKLLGRSLPWDLRGKMARRMARAVTRWLVCRQVRVWVRSQFGRAAPTCQ
eukprot:11632261-Alexandrium_andersonii.AAC.1